MAIDFPASPSLNDTFSSGGVTYTWDGTVWVASGSAAFVQKSGDTMSGALAINADLTVDTDTLYVDSTNNRVGIGTDSPTTALDVADANTNPIQIRGSSSQTSANLRLGVGSTGNSIPLFADNTVLEGRDGGLALGTSANDSILFYNAVARVERMRIDQSGNVGIGTDSPGARLHVEEGTAGANDTPEVKISSFRPIIRLEDKSTSANSAEICGDNALIFRCSVPVDDDTALTEHMRINALGNVGIGRTDPAVELDVTGEIRASTGILFGTDTAAANTLDDYEEGTWTPGIEGNTTAGSYTFTSTGAYTKVGNKVTAWGELTNITTVSAGSGITRVTGLPFTSALGFASIGSIMLDQWDLSSTAYIDVVASVSDGVNYVTPRIVRDGATDIGLQITNKTNDSADITFCVAYTVA